VVKYADVIHAMARHRRWTWLYFAIDCDIRMRRQGRRCPRWRDHRWM